MKPINVSDIYDASHAPCLVTRRSVTGVILMLNNFILRCTSKRQNTVESATYSAEMVAGRLAVEQVMNIRYKLRMLGVPVEGASVLLGDNQSVITSCSIPSSNLKKITMRLPIIVLEKQLLREWSSYVILKVKTI